MVDPSEPGFRLCIKCGWLFYSPDLMRVRRCRRCKQGDRVQEPKTGTLHLEKSDSLVQEALRDNKLF